MALKLNSACWSHAFNSTAESSIPWKLWITGNSALLVVSWILQLKWIVWSSHIDGWGSTSRCWVGGHIKDGICNQFTNFACLKWFIHEVVFTRFLDNFSTFFKSHVTFLCVEFFISCIINHVGWAQSISLNDCCEGGSSDILKYLSWAFGGSLAPSPSGTGSLTWAIEWCSAFMGSLSIQSFVMSAIIISINFNKS